MDSMAWSQTHAKLHTLLKKRILLPKNSRVLMAVSGGQDSLCMARLLLDIQPHWQWTLGLIHCDHRWREDAAANAAHVLAIADEWHVPAQCVAADKAIQSEASARAWRYETLAKAARLQGYDYVVCGHTMSDRAETVLYNLTRGTGLDGIATLPWQRPIDDAAPPVSLVRPLLTFSRQETGDFCQRCHIPVWVDSTNASLNYRRNRIRQELMPYLQEHFNPQVERSLAQTLETAAADIAYLESEAASIYKSVVSCVRDDLLEDDAQVWRINQQSLREAPLSMQRRVIRRLLQRALARPPGFQDVEKVVGLLRSPNAAQCDSLAGNRIARVCKPFILIKRAND